MSQNPDLINALENVRLAKRENHMKLNVHTDMSLCKAGLAWGATEEACNFALVFYICPVSLRSLESVSTS